MLLKNSRKQADWPSVLQELVRPPLSQSNGRLFDFNAQKVRELSEVAGSLNAIGTRFFGAGLSAPTTPIADASDAAAENTAGVIQANLDGMIEQIVEATEAYPYFGKVVFLGQHECKFTFVDSRNTHGLMKTTHNLSVHEHHLIEVRVRRLDDDDVVLPAKQLKMVQMLPDFLLPFVRIVTGTLILTKENEAGTETHEHAVGRGIRQTIETIDWTSRRAVEIAGKTARGAGALASNATRRATNVAANAASLAGQAVKEYGPTVAKGAAVITGIGLIGGLLATAAKFAVVAATDPALVIGDLVISGWIED
jgi:hypothetical protein